MGLTKFLEKKLKGDPQEREMRKRQELALKREGEQARWEGKRKGIIQRERAKGLREGRQGGGRIMGGLAEIGAHIDPTGGFGGGGFGFGPSGNPFGGSSTHRKRASNHRRGKGTTIKVNGTTITVHNRQKNRQHHHRRRENDFPF